MRTDAHSLATDAATYVLAACPDCITAREARASVFNDHFAVRLATLLVPLAAMALLAALFSWLERDARASRANAGVKP